MARDLLLALSVLLASYSQLRFNANSPVGPGELCLLAWIGWTLVASPSWSGIRASPEFRRLAAFWLAFAAALAIGTMRSYVVDSRNSLGHFFHDLLAFSLMATLGLLVLAPRDAGRRLRRAEWGLTVMGAVCLSVQLGQAYDLLPTFGLELWFYDRLIGWTTNANQIALQCLVLTFLAAHLTLSAGSRQAGMVALATLPVPVICGILSGSDAFDAAIAAGILGYAVLKTGQFAAFLFRRRPRRALMLAVILPILAASMAPLAYMAIRTPASVPVAESEDRLRLERDIGYRTELWSAAASRVVESAFLGFGPGPQLVRPADLREPVLDPLPDFEAHNTLIDLMLQGGLLAAGAFIWLMGATSLRLLKHGSNVGALLLVSLGIFAMTHFVIRHPIFWIAVCVSLVAATPRRDLRRQTG